MDRQFFDNLEALAEQAGDTPEAVVLWTLLGAIKQNRVEQFAQLSAVYAARLLRDGDVKSN